MLDFTKCRPVPVTQDDGSVVLMGPPQHVREGVAWMVDQPYCINANDMGGMKSATSILAAQFLFEQNQIDRVIVIAPAPIRPAVWYDPEIGELALHLRDDLPSLVSEFHRKIRQWRRGPTDAPRTLKWIVTNYEWLRGGKWEELLQYCGPRTLLLLDESSAVRTADSAQTEAVMRLRWMDKNKGKTIDIGNPRCGRVWLLNGTPLAEGPEDMFAQGLIMHPDIHECRYITHFRNRYAVLEDVRGAGGRSLTDKWGKPIRRVSGWKDLDELQFRFAPYVLRQDWRKNFALPGVLPPRTVSVAMTKDEWDAYRDMRDEMVVQLKSGALGIARHAAVKVMRLAQITSGLLGGLEEDEEVVDAHSQALLESLGLLETDIPTTLDMPGSFLDGLQLEPDGVADLALQQDALRNAFKPPVQLSAGRSEVVFVGRSKLDALLDLHEQLLREDHSLKLLVWFRFVPELQRWLEAVAERFPDVQRGSVCGTSVSGRPVREERAEAMRLLHPRTAPLGPAAVGGTYGTGSMGLNFTAFSTVIHCSHVYEDWKRRQADKRVDRPGQRKVVTQFDVVATGPKGQRTIDHVIIDARRKKMNLNDLTTNAWVKVLLEE